MLEKRDNMVEKKKNMVEKRVMGMGMAEFYLL